MDEGVTDEDGMFRLKGHEKEHSKIDPKVNVYHVSCFILYSKA